MDFSKVLEDHNWLRQEMSGFKAISKEMERIPVIRLAPHIVIDKTEKALMKKVLGRLHN